MATYTDPSASESTSTSTRRARTFPRIAFDGALLLLGGAVLWELGSRSLLLVALAVTACLIGGATALARLDTARREALASAAACSALSASVLLSTSKLWSPDPSVASALVLVAATGVTLSATVPVISTNAGRMVAVVATALIVGPAWAVWVGDDGISTPTAARLLAATVAVSGVAWRTPPRATLTIPLALVVAAVAGLPRLQLREVELLAVSLVGVLTAIRWWRVVARRPDGSCAPIHPNERARRPVIAMVSMLIVAVWLCGVSGAWHAAAVASAGTVVLTASAAVGWRETTWEGDGRSRSIKRVATEIARRSQIDALTRLPNRDAFDRRLDEEIERAVRYQQPVALCFVDVDHFKAVNDAHGHAVGDRVLVEVAESLRAASRAIDVVCRYGGEEFAVIAPGTWSSDAVVLADRLRGRVSSLRPVGLRGPLTISVGVAGLPEHAADSKTLQRGADEALYDAKRSGRDRTSVVRTGELTGRA